MNDYLQLTQPNDGALMMFRLAMSMFVLFTASAFAAQASPRELVLAENGRSDYRIAAKLQANYFPAQK